MRVLSGLVVAVICAAALVSNAGARPEAATDRLMLATLSTRADMVSGGDVLVEIKGASTGPVSVSVNDRDTSKVFHADRKRQSLIGVVDGLRAGRNTIIARAGSQTARLEVTNYPITGPIVSGEHLKPFVCNTVQAGLGEPLDADCSAPTKVEYFYKSAAPTAATGRGAATAAFKPLDVSAARPADIAQTTISTGATVPYIVRVESGTINRAIYRIAILDDPGASAQPWKPGPGWNHAFMMTFGGGCGTNYNQGSNQAVGAIFDAAVSRGFAHAISTQNVMQQHCNDALSGEALMMIKEHFIERYGIPKWTMGFGGSGGSIQQLLIAQNFPGLLDGLLPSLTFADSISVRPSVTDCRLLMNYYKTDAATWTKDKQTAVEGYERDFTVRERLRKANGRVDNQVIWIYPNGATGLGATVSGLAIDTMSQWLDALAKDQSSAPAIDKVVKAKPAAAVDACWTAEGTKIEEPLSINGTGKCASLYPRHSTPRLVAGSPLADDVLKCQLKAIDAKDYTRALTADEIQQLKQVFSNGVCDYSRPCVNQKPLGGTYQRLPLASPVVTSTSASRP